LIISDDRPYGDVELRRRRGGSECSFRYKLGRHDVLSDRKWSLLIILCYRWRRLVLGVIGKADGRVEDGMTLQIPVVELLWYMDIKKNLQTHCCSPTLHGEHSSRAQISIHTSECRAHLPPWNESCCSLPVVQTTSDSPPCRLLRATSKESMATAV
jgi:hypothetical protein